MTPAGSAAHGAAPGASRWATRLERHHGDRVVRCFVHRPASLDAMLRASVERNPDGEALVHVSCRLSYRQLDSRVEHVAGNLARLGVGRGDRVALLLGNLPAFVEVLLACARLGAVSVPIGTRLGPPEVHYILAHSEASVLVLEASLADRLDGAAVPHVVAVGGPLAGALDYTALLSPATAPAVSLDDEDAATLLYTSGTTGRPKGAVLTHLSQIHSAMHYARAFGYRHACREPQAADECGPGEAERGLLCVPASHVTGVTALILSMVNVAGCIVLMDGFRAADFLALAAAERMTTTVMVPAMYNLCLLQPDFASHDLSHWRVGAYGGAPMPVSSIERLARELPHLTLMNAYGATETSSPATLMPPGDTARFPDSVGRAVTCADIGIFDEHGREVASGDSGEIWIAGPMVVPGYWRDADATAAAFVGGYWRSGDVGTLDASGYLRVHDRLKDMVNRGGYKIYSVEVENELMACPGVLEAAVVARPDPVLGERVVAFVHGPGAVDGDALRRHCAARLADYKVPEIIVACDAPLPRNANGKVLKTELRERALGLPAHGV